MNPRVVPSFKNEGLFQGKMVIFSEVHGKDSSLIKDCEKCATSNYDLCHLDIVPAKSIPSKSKHVRFLSDKTSVNQTICNEQHNRKCTNSVVIEKKDQMKKSYCSAIGSTEMITNQSSNSSCGSFQIDGDDESDTTEAFNIKLSRKRTSTRPSYPPKLEKSLTTHPSRHFQSFEETKRAHSVDNDRTIAQESIHCGKITINRSTPEKTTKMRLESPSSRASKQKSPTVSKKDVRFAHPFISSSNSKDKPCTNKEFHTKFFTHKQNEKSNSSVYVKEKPSTNNSETLPHSMRSALPVRRKFSSEDKINSVNHKDTVESMHDSKCAQTKQPTYLTSHVVEAHKSDQFIGWLPHSVQSKRDSNYIKQQLTNPSMSSNINSAYFKRIEQPESDARPQVSNTIQSLTTVPSISCLNKDAKSVNKYDLSSVLSTVFSKFPRDEVLSKDFTQMSASLSGSLSSTVATTCIFKPRRSLSCLEKGCDQRNSVGCITTKNVRKVEEKSTHSASSTLLGNYQGAIMSELGPNSSPTLNTKFNHSLLPISSTKYKNLASVMNNESIAASYQLDYCWFCGRQMPTLGIGGACNDELLLKLAELERLLAEAQAEKIELLQEQVNLRNSQKRALQKNEVLEKELEQILLKEKNVQLETTMTVTTVLTNTNTDFDLRAHLESSGHQLDICKHILVSRHSCRGFLLKFGGRFRMWRKRWFVLDITKRMVIYFTDKTESKFKGSISLQAIDDVYVDHLRIVKSPSPKLTFCVKTCDKTYQLVAPSSDTMTIWVDALFSAADEF